MDAEEMRHVTMVTGRLNNELDHLRIIRDEAQATITRMVTRSRRHRAQALVFGIILGYAAGVWTALGAQ